MVLLIAFIPALVVYGISWYTNNKMSTLVAAILATLLGVFTGSPVFIGVDLLFVVLALAFSYHHINVRTKRAQEESERLARIAEMQEAAAFKSWHQELLVVRERRRAMNHQRMREARLKAIATKRNELRAEQTLLTKAANDQSLLQSARARATERLAEIEALIRMKYSEGDA